MVAGVVGIAEMDKDYFVKQAPIYYALAIVIYLSEGGYVSTTRNALVNNFVSHIDPDDPDAVYYLLGKEELFDAAIRWLVAQDMISEPRRSVWSAHLPKKRAVQRKVRRK